MYIKVLIAFAILCAISVCAFAQQSNYPQIIKYGVTEKAFLPGSWHVLKQTRGDLNADGVPDAAMIIQMDSALRHSRPKGEWSDGHPRILVVLFATRTGYELALQNNGIIDRDDEGGMVNDALDSLFIRNRVLNIDYKYVRSHDYYKYRYQQGGFYLIGFTSAGVTLDNFESWDCNFLTRKAEHIYGKVGDEKNKREWKTLKIKKLNSLQEVALSGDWADVLK